MKQQTLFDLRCAACGFSETTTIEELLARLRRIGFLRRDKEPTPELVLEIANSRAGQWPCTRCQAASTAIEIRDDSNDWPEPRRCAGCGQAIPDERLEIFPNADQCAACEGKPRDEWQEDPQFCPRCGSRMQVARSRRPGIARYILACPICPERTQ